MGNLFHQLFTFRPRENSSASENFLTESFTYFLERDKAVLDAFLDRIFKEKVDVEHYELVTRLHEQLTCKTRYPDLKLIVQACNGERYVIISEHKWDSHIRPSQLVDYEDILCSTMADHRQLVTIVARADQKRAAESAPLKLSATHLLSEDVYLFLKNLNNKDPLLYEFLEFMETNSLNPGRPIDSETMKAFLRSSDFKTQLTRFTKKLLLEYDWTCVPQAHRSEPEVRDRFGRVAIEFQTAGWNPSLAIGFLYDNKDHMVSLTAPGESVDLFLRIEADPRTNPQIDGVLAVLRQKATPLATKRVKVLTRNEPGNGNLWTLLIAQQSLASVVGDGIEERGQIEAIYNRVQEWIKCLFEDGSVEKSLSTLKPIKSAIQVDAPA